MFHRNLKNYQDKLIEAKKEFNAIEYICSEEFAQWVDKHYHIIKPKIKRGDRFTIMLAKNERGFDLIVVMTSAGSYWDMPTDIVNTCKEAKNVQ